MDFTARRVVLSEMVTYSLVNNTEECVPEHACNIDTSFVVALQNGAHVHT